MRPSASVNMEINKKMRNQSPTRNRKRGRAKVLSKKNKKNIAKVNYLSCSSIDIFCS